MNHYKEKRRILLGQKFSEKFSFKMFLGQNKNENYFRFRTNCYGI